MTIIGWTQILLFCAIVAALAQPLGWYMTRVFSGERTWLSPVLHPVETGLYRLGGVDETREQHWLTYTVAMLLLQLGGFLALYALMRWQPVLPLNPQDQTAVAPDLAFNTAISFVTNTNWQNYGGETTMSYLAQMLGLTVQNFLSAATGIVLAVALIRGFARSSMRTVGNFWVDITRATLYVLLPMCVVFALVLVWQGIPQTLHGPVEAATLEGATQTIAIGPVASQVAIKMLGTNGGGFFNVNASHPFENPTALSNFLQMLSIFAIGAGGSPMCSAAWSATSGRVMRSSRRWVCCSSPASPSPTGRKPAAIPDDAGARPHRRQRGRQGGPLRHRRLGAVRGHHHRRVLRRGQCDA